MTVAPKVTVVAHFLLRQISKYVLKSLQAGMMRWRWPSKWMALYGGGVAKVGVVDSAQMLGFRRIPWVRQRH